VNDFVVSLIRTYVPLAVGYLVAWLASTFNIVIPDDASQGLVLFVGAVLTAVYYLVARGVEAAWPGLGKILVGLGIGKAPQYPAVPAVGPRIRSGPAPY
jgi:hypothetical protein